MHPTETKIVKVVPWSFRVPMELLQDFKQAASSENRSAAGELRHLMEQRVAEFKATSEDRIPASTSGGPA